MSAAPSAIGAATAKLGAPAMEIPIATVVEEMEAHPAWPMLSRMPLTLEVRVPMSRFTVRDLLALEQGKTIESAWPTTEDVPLRVGPLQVSWSEFEVVDDHIALRVTRLA